MTRRWSTPSASTQSRCGMRRLHGLTSELQQGIRGAWALALSFAFAVLAAFFRGLWRWISLLGLVIPTPNASSWICCLHHRLSEQACRSGNRTRGSGSTLMLPSLRRRADARRDVLPPLNAHFGHAHKHKPVPASTTWARLQRAKPPGVYS